MVGGEVGKVGFVSLEESCVLLGNSMVMRRVSTEILSKEVIWSSFWRMGWRWAGEAGRSEAPEWLVLQSSGWEWRRSELELWQSLDERVLRITSGDRSIKVIFQVLGWFSLHPECLQVSETLGANRIPQSCLNPNGQPLPLSRSSVPTKAFLLWVFRFPVGAFSWHSTVP